MKRRTKQSSANLITNSIQIGIYGLTDVARHPDGPLRDHVGGIIGAQEHDPLAGLVAHLDIDTVGDLPGRPEEIAVGVARVPVLQRGPVQELGRLPEHRHDVRIAPSPAGLHLGLLVLGADLAERRFDQRLAVLVQI